MTATETRIEQLCIDTIRTLAMDTVQKANSGHPGTPMGAAATAFTLWDRFLKHNPKDPHWPDRDRFVLSAGHASVLLYSLLALTGYDLKLEELQQFRQLHSRTPGHPEYGLTPGVEVTTGPLGQGFAMAVGMGMAERFLAARFNRPGHEIVDHHIYCLCSDGDMMEGISSEAASLAGTLGLGNLIYIYDKNNISIEGSTDLAFREDVGARFEAYGWYVQAVDGEDTNQVADAIERARSQTERPSLIVAHTVIGYGSPNLAGSEKTHGSALGEDEVRATKRAIGWPEDAKFRVPDEALAEFRKAIDRGRTAQDDWNTRMEAYAREFPEEAALFRQVVSGSLPQGWADAIPTFGADDGAMATRKSSGKVLNELIKVLPNLIGGSADLAPSNDTNLKGYGAFGIEEWTGHNIHFGVRENAMGGVVNGMAMHGGVIPYSGTFLCFSDYMRPTIRIGSIMQAHSIYIFTHDSIGLGEDGPTHQPIEHLASLRAMPGLRVIRAADANETAWAWKIAIEKPGPTALVLTRQNVPTMDNAPLIRAGMEHGAYVLQDPDGVPDVILIGTGSELQLAVEAAKRLGSEGVKARVVSMPCWELFEEQSAEYRDSVLPAVIKARVAVEAGASLGWHKWVGDAGEFLGIDHFGGSAPAEDLFRAFGITTDALVEKARSVLQRTSANGSR